MVRMSGKNPVLRWLSFHVLGMVHIEQNERVLVGLDGNLFFANLLKSDSKQDYICNAQYVAARTILPEAAIALTVQPSELHVTDHKHISISIFLTLHF